MKLYLTATSEQGKAITKSGNEFINITLNREHTPTYFIGWYNNQFVIEHIPTETIVFREVDEIEQLKTIKM